MIILNVLLSCWIDTAVVESMTLKMSDKLSKIKWGGKFEIPMLGEKHSRLPIKSKAESLSATLSFIII